MRELNGAYADIIYHAEYVNEVVSSVKKVVRG